RAAARLHRRRPTVWRRGLGRRRRAYHLSPARGPRAGGAPGRRGRDGAAVIVRAGRRPRVRAVRVPGRGPAVRRFGAGRHRQRTRGRAAGGEGGDLHGEQAMTTISAPTTGTMTTTTATTKRTRAIMMITKTTLALAMLVGLAGGAARAADPVSPADKTVVHRFALIVGDSQGGPDRVPL